MAALGQVFNTKKATKEGSAGKAGVLFPLGRGAEENKTEEGSWRLQLRLWCSVSLIDMLIYQLATFKYIYLKQANFKCVNSGFWVHERLLHWSQFLKIFLEYSNTGFSKPLQLPWVWEITDLASFPRVPWARARTSLGRVGRDAPLPIVLPLKAFLPTVVTYNLGNWPGHPPSHVIR